MHRLPVSVQSRVRSPLLRLAERNFLGWLDDVRVTDCDRGMAPAEIAEVSGLLPRCMFCNSDA